ncbi:hypothetical protein GGR57DRAFT_351330 [Xylariaceae sp. FL1272]|nr:hypothetical protein GGR57DRAFT_351330 [Xylariaceae sp. FL1272]
MSYLPTKRQRSNTSRESSNAIPQTNPPALRQHPSHLNANLALYPSAAAATAVSNGYTNGPYATAVSPVHHQPQPINYAQYPTSSVTAQHNGYSTTGSPGPYQNPASTAAYGTSATYGNAHQTNPYANQYTHTTASPQLSPLPGQYTTAALSGVTNGNYGQPTHNPQQASRMPYSPVSASHQSTASYHHPPQRTDTLGSLHTPPQHTLPSYGDSYASHTASHAQQYQPAHSPYPESLGTHYSPPPLPTPHDVSRHMSEDLPPDEIDDEDAQGEPADESPEIYTHSEPSRPVSSIPTPSTDPTDLSKTNEPKCNCKKGRGKKKACQSCDCSKYGLACTTLCSCGPGCGNPFADLSTFFGPNGTSSKPCGANPCFATWLTNQLNIEDLDVELMVDILLTDDESWAQIRGYTEAFQRWEDAWKKVRNGKAKKAKDERERLEFELLRGALGNSSPDDFNGYRYSFCQSKWVPSDVWEHCAECATCRSAGEWHCDRHGRCTKDRVCPSCASTTTLPYHLQQHHPVQQQQQMMYSTHGT